MSSGAPAVSVDAHVPERGLHLGVEVPPGQVLAVLGANGAGKSSLLNLVSGLLRPAAGHVRVNGRPMADDDTWVPAHARGVATLAQRPLLFPHLDVLANVAFGPRSTGMARRAAEQLARERLAQMGADQLAERRPHELSGGQAQRVALARALAPDPQVVLLDEPLAALDVEAGAAVRQLLRRVLRETARTSLLVTHDLLDVLALADAVVVLADGRLIEQGPTWEVLTRPRSPFTAQLAGVNLVAGTLRGDALVTDPPGVVLHGLIDPACRAGQPAAATYSPRAVAVHRTPPGGSPRNTVPVTINSLEAQGELVRVRASSATGQRLTADITPTSVASLALTANEEVTFSVKAAEVHIYPA